MVKMMITETFLYYNTMSCVAVSIYLICHLFRLCSFGEVGREVK